MKKIKVISECSPTIFEEKVNDIYKLDQEKIIDCVLSINPATKGRKKYLIFSAIFTIEIDNET